MTAEPSAWNLPNALTILRIILGVIVPYLVLQKDLLTQVVAAVLFAIAAVSDWFDGWYARKYNLITRLGKILDPIADKVIVLSCFVALSSVTHLDMYSIWWIVPIFIREIAITVYRLLFLLQRRPEVVAAEWSGKAKTFMQMLTLPMAYFLYMFKTYLSWEHWALQWLLYAMLLFSLYLTIYSGVMFVIKNWAMILKVSLSKK
jgi:CDP-diacylglycerol--glycerol-3-phosphate 3-phosphatidyltransferase